MKTFFKNFIILTGIFLSLIFLFSCASMTQYGKLEKAARQNYAVGSYDDAVIRAVASLKLNRDYEKSQILVQDAFKAAVKKHTAQISTLKSSTEKFRWDNVVKEYEDLIKINNAVGELPTIQNKKTKEELKFEIIDYSSELSDAKNNAAESHYQEGLLLSKTIDLDTQKKAAKEFKTSYTYVPDYKDAMMLYEKSKKAGLKRIAIIPFEDKSGKEGKYGNLSGLIVDDIVSMVLNDAAATEFLEIVTRDQIEQVIHEQKFSSTVFVDESSVAEVGKILGVHEILTGQINQVIYTPERTVNKTYQAKQRVVTGKEKYTGKDGKTHTRDVYGDVYANVTTYTKTSSAKITGSYKIIDVATAKLKKTESVSGEESYQFEWAKFSGDERALDYNERKLASKQEEFAPVEDVLVTDAAKSLSRSLGYKLIDYAK